MPGFFCLMAWHRWRRAAWLVAILLVAACAPKFDFREIRSADGEFVVMLPDRPQTVSRELDIEGHKVTMTMVSTGVGPSLFAVGVARLPAEALATDQSDATLAWFRDGLVRNIGGQITAQEPAMLSATAAAGRSVRAGQSVQARGRIGADGKAAQLAARLYLVDDRFYQVVAMGAGDELTPETLETFFSSFRLTPR